MNYYALGFILGLLLVAVSVAWWHERRRRIHAEALLADAVAELADGWADEPDYVSAGTLGWGQMPAEWQRVTARHHAEQVAQESEDDDADYD